MLIITRNKEQVLVIGDPKFPEDQVRIKILSKGRTKLGISAPSYVPVNREEVATRIQEQE